MQKIIFLFLFLFSSLEARTLRVGHFPNITHAQGLLGHSFTRSGEGWFEKYLGDDVKLEWYTYNAGGSAMEAIFAGSLDLTYTGPAPAINAFIRSGGEEVRILSGACSGGSALVVTKKSDIKSVADFRSKKIATPQLGSTQDVACRSWLITQGFQVTLTGGDVLVIPTTNASQLVLFLRGELDGAWSVEPWVSLLLTKGEATLFLEESQLWPDGKYATTLLAGRKELTTNEPLLTKQFIEAHAALTEWIHKNPEEAIQRIQKEIFAELGITLPKEIVERAFHKLLFTTDPLKQTVEKMAENSFKLGFLSEEPHIEGLFYP